MEDNFENNSGCFALVCIFGFLVAFAYIMYFIIFVLPTFLAL